MKVGAYRSNAMLLPLAALVAGCAAPFPVGPDYRGPSGEAAPPARWQVGWLPKPAPSAADAPALPGASAPPAEVRAASVELLRGWWQQFDDPLLAELIDSAQGASSTLAQAALRIAQARSDLSAAQAVVWPLFVMPRTANTVTVDRMPRMTMTMRSSTRVNPANSALPRSGQRRAREAARTGEATGRDARLADTL
jgi:outer membrane protein TolC